MNSILLVHKTPYSFLKKKNFFLFEIIGILIPYNIPTALSIDWRPNIIIANPPIISISSAYLIAICVPNFPASNHKTTQIRLKINNIIRFTLAIAPCEARIKFSMLPKTSKPQKPLQSFIRFILIHLHLFCFSLIYVLQ